MGRGCLSRPAEASGRDDSLASVPDDDQLDLDVDLPSRCPQCGCTIVEVIEDVSDEVTVYGCTLCGVTWAQRRDAGW